MSGQVKSWLKRVATHRIPVALSIAVGSMALTAGTFVGPVGGNLAFHPFTGQVSQASSIFSADPNPIQICDDSTVAVTLLRWNIGQKIQYEVHRDSETGRLLKKGTGSGSYRVKNVADDSQFYLVTFRNEIRRISGVRRTVRVKDQVVPLKIAHTTEGCAPEPQELVCSPVTQQAAISQAVTLTASGGSGNYEWTAPSAGVANTTTDTVIISYNSPGEKVITLSDGEESAECIVQVSGTTPTPTPPAPNPLPSATRVVCNPGSQTVAVNQNVTLTATGGTGTYNWSALGGFDPGRSGTAFTTRYSTGGTKSITVTSGNQSATCTVTVTAPVPQNQTPIGAVDGTACDVGVTGWGADPNSPDTAVDVRIIVDGTVAATLTTNQVRADVNNYIGQILSLGRAATGNHGYVWPISASLKDNLSHTLSVEAKDLTTGTWHKLNPGAGRTTSIICSAPASHLKLSGQITAPDSLDVCPGPDSQIGSKPITLSASTSGYNIAVNKIIVNSTARDESGAVVYSDTPLMVYTHNGSVSWEVKLSPTQGALTYTFELIPYGSGYDPLLGYQVGWPHSGTVIATKTMQARPMGAGCDPGRYRVDVYSDNVPFCPHNAQYTRLYATGVVYKAHSQPAVSASDGFTLRFRPIFSTAWQTLPLQSRNIEVVNGANTFYFATTPITAHGAGDYEFTWNFRGHKESGFYSIGKTGPFCE